MFLFYVYILLCYRYNGYMFGETVIYNPWSITRFIESKRLESYWCLTGSNEIITNFLKGKFNSLGFV